MAIPENLITAISTLSGAVIGAWLASGRAHKEKVWDLRRQAYGVILSEIAMIDRIMDRVQAMLADDSFRYFDSPERPANEEKIGDHWTKAAQRFADDYLVLSAEFISIFEKLELDNSEESNESWPEEQDRFASNIKSARVLLAAQARNEVTKPPTRWLRWPPF